MGKPRKPYTRVKPIPRDETLADRYIDTLNETGDFQTAAKILGVSTNAIKMYFRRNGITWTVSVTAHRGADGKA